MEWETQKFHNDRLLTLREVSELLGVSPKTVSRWCRQGKIAHIKTLGGHRRVYASEVRKILEVNKLDDC